jgi:hypothetical protein
VIVLLTGLFLSESVGTLFRLFPPALLGVILMFGGLELAAGVQPTSATKADRYVLVFTAGVAIWNMGAAYLGGLALWYGFNRGWLKA